LEVCYTLDLGEVLGLQGASHIGIDDGKQER